MTSLRVARALRSLLVMALVSLVLAATALPVGAAPKADRGGTTVHPHAKDRVIVGFKPNASKAKRNKATGSIGDSKAKRLSSKAPNAAVVKLPKGKTVDEAIDELSELPGVAYVEPDYWVKAADTSNDPYFTDGRLWGMHGDATAHQFPFGSGAGEAWANGHIGKRNVFVGVIDEGIKHSHPDLSANVWTNPFETANGKDDDGNGFVDDIHGWDFDSGDATVYDGTVDDHGTHVAGTIGAIGGNDRGVAGVNWRVTMIPAKFLGTRGGWSSNAAKALDYLTDLKLRHGLDIVATNNSWGGGGYSQTLLDAINRAGDAGILFIAAAGNKSQNTDDATDPDSPYYPSSYRCDTRADGSARGWDCLISVANITSDGLRANSSNWGAVSVDLGAPGTNIWSTHPGSRGYEAYTGTSMATPHVTGAVALCASLDSGLSARRLRDLVIETGKATASMAGVTRTGDRLDIGALAKQCTPATPDPTPDPTPRPTPTVPPVGATLTVDDLSGWFTRNGSGWRQAPNGYAKHHYWVPTRQYSKQRSGAWKPTLAQAGYYEIKVKIPRWHASTRRAAYKVKTASGWATLIRNQYKKRGKWLSLGVHRLTTTPIVKLADKTGELASKDRRLAFDAVRFIPADAPTTTSAQPSGGETSAPESQPDVSSRQPEPGAGPTPSPASTATPAPTPAPSPTSTPAPTPTPRPSLEVTPPPSEDTADQNSATQDGAAQDVDADSVEQ